MINTWFNAVRHLHRQYWKEQLVLACAWSAAGAVIGLATYRALHLLAGS